MDATTERTRARAERAVPDARRRYPVGDKSDQVGLLLLLGAAGWERGITTFVSSVMAICGLIILLGVDNLPAALTTNTGYGAMLLIVGGALLLIATVIPAVRSQRRVGHMSAH
jgi:hypothetical protein